MAASRSSAVPLGIRPTTAPVEGLNTSRWLAVDTGRPLISRLKVCIFIILPKNYCGLTRVGCDGSLSVSSRLAEALPVPLRGGRARPAGEEGRRFEREGAVAGQRLRHQREYPQSRELPSAVRIGEEEAS